MGHITDGLAIFTRQILVPGAGEHDVGRQANGADTGEIVLQRSRTIHVGQSHFADRLDDRVLITGIGDEIVHVVKGELVKQLIPLDIVVVDATFTVFSSMTLCDSERTEIR